MELPGRGRAARRRLCGAALREAASDLLTRICAPAVELLIDVLMQHNPAVAPRWARSSAASPGRTSSRPDWLDAVEPERRLRGVEALGAIGGPEAADGSRVPSPTPTSATAAAQEALGRLSAG